MKSELVRSLHRRHWIALAALALICVVSCVFQSRAPTAVQRWWKERGPVVPHDSFPADCSLCHTSDGWRTIRSDFSFDHELETGVKLAGAHRAAECLRCHNDRGPVAVFAARGCAGCHEDPHRAQLGADCGSCHVQENWRPNEQIAAHSRTRFPLIGAHAVAACFRCHPGAQSGNFTRVGIDCESCHQDDFARATSPDHVAQGWTTNCETCHLPTAWSGGSFVHSTWPLTGQHTRIACDACHTSGVFAGTPSECVDCHLAAYQATTDPNHTALNFGTDCRLCHNTRDWDEGVFVHTGIVDNCVTCHLSDYQATTDPNHATAGYGQSCEQCHGTNSWNFSHAGISSGCVDCHLTDYQGTTDPNHTTAGFGQTCEQCHVTSSWNAAFSHTGITSGCIDCHLTDYQATSNPNHAASGFGQTCEQCHGTNSWNFSHAGITSGCVDCHLSDYQGTTSPNHALAGFGQICEQCHVTSSWNANFSHSGITSGCVNCHLTDYQGANDPNHVAANIPQTCETCHGTSSWTVTNFSHSGITSACAVCHMADYQSATDPNHLGANFGTTCESCHTSTNNWNQANFTHNFPINSGDHNNLNCTQCHLVPSDYNQFSCTHCHEHRQSSMNSEHSGVNGYVWLSSACYNCHPDGQAD